MAERLGCVPPTNEETSSAPLVAAEDCSLTRPAAAIAGWVGVAAVAAVLVVVLGDNGRAQPQETAADDPRGEQVYAATCAACHGPGGGGLPGAEGIRAGPPILGLETAYVDQLLRTGRMPIRSDELGVNREKLTDDEREAALAWMVDTMGLAGQVPTVREGDRARGHELYGIYCAACHGATGQGGIGAEGTLILEVTDLDPVAVAEAIRVGPFDMPRFEAEVLSDEDVDAIVTFVAEDLSDPPRTLLGVGEMHRVTFWGFATLIAFLLVGLCAVLARKVPAPSVPEEELR